MSIFDRKKRNKKYSDTAVNMAKDLFIRYAEYDDIILDIYRHNNIDLTPKFVSERKRVTTKEMGGILLYNAFNASTSLYNDLNNSGYSFNPVYTNLYVLLYYCHFSETMLHHKYSISDSKKIASYAYAGILRFLREEYDVLKDEESSEIFFGLIEEEIECILDILLTQDRGTMAFNSRTCELTKRLVSKITSDKTVPMDAVFLFTVATNIITTAKFTDILITDYEVSDV